MQTTLYITHKDEKTELIPCSANVSFGRETSNNIILDDPMVSRHHGMIRMMSQEQFYIFDTGSSNGVYLNMKRISTPTLLKDGDFIQIGNNAIKFNQKCTVKIDSNSDACAETMHSLQANIRNIIVLVSDIRGFTTLSESLPITTLTKLMSTWFQEVQIIIENLNGTVAVFIGDCVLAQWTVEENSSDSYRSALKASLELKNLSKVINEKFPELQHELRIGVGLNQGVAAVGLGTDNTIMGDVVNTTFRLESMSKELKTDVVINSSFAQELPGLEQAGQQKTVKVTGKSEVLSISSYKFSQREKFLT